MGIVQGKLLAEGKTKRIWQVGNEVGRVVVEFKDDMTAGDGKKHDVIAGKAELSALTNANVFNLLKKCGIPVTFDRQLDATRFLARYCEMISYEVVVRREAHGSYLKRHPEISKGHVFPQLVLEFFLKTSGRRFGEITLPCDDPFVLFEDGKANLYLPDSPMSGQKPFLCLEDYPLRGFSDRKDTMGRIAIKTFLILEKAWQLFGRRLVDFKVEFGMEPEFSTIWLSDDIDNGAWRLLENGRYIDKQLYRDGASLDEVSAKYRLVSELTRRFGLPTQQIILWLGSKSDDFKPFEPAVASYGATEICGLQTVVGSAHKEPVRACDRIVKLVQEIPDSVVIAAVGRSNGAGPMLSSQISVPVLTVPANWKEFPDDVWSSLRTPSEAPAATILDPKNAVLCALQILAMRNPRLYAELRIRQEERLANFVLL